MNTRVYKWINHQVLHGVENNFLNFFPLKKRENQDFVAVRQIDLFSELKRIKYKLNHNEGVYRIVYVVECCSRSSRAKQPTIHIFTRMFRQRFDLLCTNHGTSYLSILNHFIFHQPRKRKRPNNKAIKVCKWFLFYWKSPIKRLTWITSARQNKKIEEKSTFVRKLTEFLINLRTHAQHLWNDRWKNWLRTRRRERNKSTETEPERLQSSQYYCVSSSGI